MPPARHDSRTITSITASATVLLTQIRSITPAAVATDGLGSPHSTHACLNTDVRTKRMTGTSSTRKKQHASTITWNTARHPHEPAAQARAQPTCPCLRCGLVSNVSRLRRRRELPAQLADGAADAVEQLLVGRPRQHLGDPLRDPPHLRLLHPAGRQGRRAD